MTRTIAVPDASQKIEITFVAIAIGDLPIDGNLARCRAGASGRRPAETAGSRRAIAPRALRLAVGDARRLVAIAHDDPSVADPGFQPASARNGWRRRGVASRPAHIHARHAAPCGSRCRWPSSSLETTTALAGVTGGSQCGGERIGLGLLSTLIEPFERKAEGTPHAVHSSSATRSSMVCRRRRSAAWPF